MTGPALSVVIPCFDERENAERFARDLFPALAALGSSFEVVAVDDGSTDGTRQALEKLKSGGAPLELAVHDRNRGLGAALRTGFARSRGEWIATLDADLTSAPASIGDLLRRQRETDADLVAGSPFLEKTGLAAVPWRRRLPSLMLNAFYRGFLRHDFSSYTPILRLYRAWRLKPLDLRSNGFEINAEIAARFIQAGWKIAEVPAVLSSRALGRSKLSACRESARHAGLLLRLARAASRRKAF